jgi:membrane protein DedA with SNARE-associated domain
MDLITSLFDLDAGILLLRSLPNTQILILAFLLTFVENIFPPSPSDVLLMFTGSLISIANVDFTSLLLSSTLGSVIGFLVMYYLGKEFGIRIVDSNRFKFINSNTLKKPEEWFSKYGYYIIVANRFLSGTRAVISFFAGISKLPIGKITILSAISAAIWNSILILIGNTIGDNIELMKSYISLYGKFLIPLLLIGIIIFFLVRRFKRL